MDREFYSEGECGGGGACVRYWEDAKWKKHLGL